MPDGSSKITEKTTYNTENNIAVFSESFDFIVSSPDKAKYFNLEIYQHHPEEPLRKHVISKTTIYITSKFFSEDNKLVLPTPFPSDLILCFVLDGSKGLKEKITVDKTEISPSTRPPRESQREEGLSFNTGQLDFLKLGPLFYDFVVALSPMVLVTEKMYDFFTWADPHKTLLYSAALMIFYCFYRGLAIVFFLVFFCSSSIIITSFMRAKPLKETADTKLQIYKRNLLFIQVSLFANE